MWWGLNYQRVVALCVVWLGLVTVAKAVVPDGTIVHTVLMTDYAPLFTGGIGFYLLYRFGSARMSWAVVAVSFLLAVPAARFRASMEASCWSARSLGWLSWVRGRWVVTVVAAAMIVLAWLVHRYVERRLAALLKHALSGVSTRVYQRVKA